MKLLYLLLLRSFSMSLNVWTQGGVLWLCTNAVAVAAAAAPPPNAQSVRDLHVILRGKTYHIEEAVTTVRELQDQMRKIVKKNTAGGEEEGEGSNVISSPQSILYDGKRLNEDDCLSQVGVSDGCQLSMIPTTTTSSSSSSSPTTSNKKSKKASSSSSSSLTPATSSSSGDNNETSDTDFEKVLQEYLKQAGVDTTQLEEMFKKMAGASSGGGGMPSMKESLEMMNNMMQSDIFQSYMNDPVKLEQSRLMILNNPMLKSMMAGMPGIDQVLNDPVAWRQAMQAAASMYKSMDPDMLMSIMSGTGAGAGGASGGMGMGGIPPGLFDGTLDSGTKSAAAKALDELDDDE